MIYHVVTNGDWQKALQQGFYEAGSLATEGFIHTSKEHQVKGYWKGIIKTKLIFYCCILMKIN